MKVIVLVARGLQAGALGAYGNAWIDTPTLDSLAAGGVVFDQHFADAADAAGARRAWRSGLYQLPAQPKSQAGADLIGAIREKQVFTSLIVDQSRPAPAEFEAGWDEVAYADADEKGSALEVALDIARASLVDLEAHEHWLLWIDLATLAPPWEIPSEFLDAYFREEVGDEEDEPEEAAENEPEARRLEPLPAPTPGMIDPRDDELFLRLQTTYAAAVSYLDTAVGELLEAVREAGLDEDALVIVTSDVGQALGEHGSVGHERPSVHEEVIHVPLIVRLPRGAEAGRRVAGFTQAVDLAATLAEAFGTTLPGVHGHSLWPLLRGEVDKVRDEVVAGVRVGDETEWCLRTPEWTFLLQDGPNKSPEPQLYVKPDDRHEVNDVRQHHPELVEELEKKLRGLVAETRRLEILGKAGSFAEMPAAHEAVIREQESQGYQTNYRIRSFP